MIHTALLLADSNAPLGWLGLAGIVFGTTVPSLVLAYRKKQDTDTNRAAQEAIGQGRDAAAAAKMVETAFAGVKNQAEMASAAADLASKIATAAQETNKRCENRCDELTSENAALRAENVELRADNEELRAELDIVRQAVARAESQLEELRGNT